MLSRKAIAVAAVAASVVGLGTAAVEKAKAYVVKNPDGRYAPLAFQFLVEAGWRFDATGLIATRPVLDDLIFRAEDLRPKQVRQSSYDNDGDGGSERLPQVDTRPGTKGEAQKASQQIITLTLRLRRDVDRCDLPPPEEDFLNCIGRVLQVYADQLERVPRTQNSVVPVAVPELRKAAARVRSARSIPQARAAVAEASTVIRKSIALVKAGTDDAVRRLEIGQRSIIAEGLAAVDAKLVRAIGI